MNTINYSNRAAKSLSDCSDRLKKQTIRKLREVRENPDRYLTPIDGYSFHRLSIDDEYVAIVDWKRERDEIRILTVGPLDNFHGMDVQ